MNVLSLFDGLSGGRLALDRAGIDYGKYYASEVDKFAIQVAAANYKDTIHIGDVRDIVAKELPEITLLVGGSPCFGAGTKVLTRKGYSNIEDIKIGDEVLTHKGRFRKVLATGGEVKETIELFAQGFKKTITTSNHPYYCREMVKVYESKDKPSSRVLKSAVFKKAGELEKDDFLATPILHIEENPRNLDEETCWILGRYLADGHYRKDLRKGRKNSYQYQLILSIGKDKEDSFKSSIKNRNYSFYPHTKSVYRAVFSSMELVNMVIEMGLGKGAINKNIPTEILLLPTNLLKCFMEGYISGDGYSSKEGVYNASSISEELIMGLSLVVAKVYGTNASFHHFPRPKTTVIEGRTVNQNDTFSTEFRDHTPKQSHSVVEGSYIWTRFKSTKPTGRKERVYNLEVEEDNTYTANNAVVHNCQNFSFSGNQKGASTKCDIEITTLDHYLELKEKGFEFTGQSYLFWEYVRLLKELKPKYFMLENVNMKQKWKDVLTKGLKDNFDGEVFMYDINSSLVSAQSRRRLYWTNIPDVPQPEDKGILLKDILEKRPSNPVVISEGSTKRFTRYGVPFVDKDTKKARCLAAREYEKNGKQGNYVKINKYGETLPINYSSSGRGDKGVESRVMVNPDKAHTLTKGGYGSRSFTGVVTDTPSKNGIIYLGSFEDGRRLFDGRNLSRNFREGYRVYSSKGKSGTLTSNSKGGLGGYTGLYEDHDIIRKLTPTECERLQTIPTGYTHYVSNTQSYKMLGNGWTIDVVAHILRYGDFKFNTIPFDECTLL
jgi:site-specific DNA-cytosine methylase